jgi:hypothetical protein
MNKDGMSRSQLFQIHVYISHVKSSECNMFKYELLNAFKNINGTLYDCIVVPACVLFVRLECIFLKVKVTGIC